VATIAGLAESRGVAVELEVSETLAPVSVGRTLLRQALFNLLGYAMELVQGGRVLLSAAETSRGVELRLDVRRRRGRPAAPSREPSADAEALLAAGRQLLVKQGGTVDLHPHADGSLLVDVVLPPVRMPKVLVIDDNPDVGGLFRRYLRHANYRLIQASTAESALRLAVELQPDVITLDLMMPSQDGWEILQHLRNAEVTRSIPVLVCSVLPERALALSLGVAGFLAKPITRASLLAALERAIGNQQSAHRE
jgi:CheY-like chemotaxis protein